MCEECRSTPCVMGCPNAPFPAIAECKYCGNDMHYCDTIYKFADVFACKNCVDEAERDGEIYKELDYE